MSGGQKQRICIARAILKKPKVLILDDSTSAVDTATEAKIRSGLAEKLPDMTKIIIAQRISSVRHADQIIIMDRGMWRQSAHMRVCSVTIRSIRKSMHHRRKELIFNGKVCGI